MVIKKFKSAITYFNVMISSFSPELPLVRRQMRGGGGECKERIEAHS